MTTQIKRSIMLDVKFYSNNKSNDWLVRQFAAYRFSDALLTEKFIPRPDVSIIFHFKNQPSMIDNGNILLEPLFVTSIPTHSFTLHFRGPMDTFVVICKPTVLSCAFGIELVPFPSKAIDLSNTVFQSLWEHLSQCETTEDRINYFTDFINAYCPLPYCPDTIDLFYNKIIDKGPRMLLKDIVKESPACQRSLQRNFKKRTGITPKKLLRLVRFDYLWTKINNEKTIDYQDLVFDGNYFDQAHFINDFKSITGETPSYFFNRNLQITKMFSGRGEGTIA